MEERRSYEESIPEVEKYVKRLYLLSQIRVCCSIGMLVIVLVSAVILVPRLMHTFAEVDSAVAQIGDMREELDSAMEEMASGMEALKTAASGMDELDFGTLNEAIADLGAVVEPLSRLFGR